MTSSVALDDALVRECRVFARHLADAEPAAYALECYARLAPTAELPPEIRGQLIERTLMSMGRSGGVVLRIADAYACVMRPRSELRRKLILVVAILENSPTTSAQFNSAAEGSFVGVSVRMTASMIASVLCAMAGVVVIGPVHLVSALGSRA